METSRLQRRHATVMSADVAGYSRMMARNDVLTFRALMECLEQIARLVRTYNGRVVDSVGDNLLAEFPCERAALCCASQVQLMLFDRNRACSPAERMEFRIGLSAGSLLCNDTRLYGDVVNVASRLQSTAEPGRILVSEAVAMQVGRDFEDRLIDHGEQQFKNIPYTVRAFEAGVRRAS